MRLKTFVLLLLLLMMTPCLTWAQKKELSQARTILKSGKRVEEAEKLMTGLLKKEANKDNKRIYAVWYESVLMQYQAVNEKLYMNQKQDTAQFYELTRRLFTVAESLDSLDMRPDKKGRVEPEYRKDHAEQLMKYRPNLFFAITYFIRKNDYKRAYEFGEFYLNCADQPLFKTYRLDSLDTRMTEAAYWTTYAGYRMNDPVLTLRYRKLALRDSSRAMSTLQFMAVARQKLKDDSLYLETLREGFRRDVTNDYFFSHLMDIYAAKGDYEQALATVEQSLEKNDSSQLYLFAKSTVLLNMGRYDESIALCKQLIEKHDSMPEPYYNAGIAYMNKALKLHPLREKKQMRMTYQKARPYMERYRLLAPMQKHKWGPALYRIYLNLNMGEEFDEIDRLLKK